MLPVIRVTSAALLSLAVAQVSAQSWPAKPVRVIVPSSPGGGTDIVARIVTPELSKRMGQQFVVIRNMPTPGSEAARAREARLAKKGKLVVEEKHENDVAEPKKPISKSTLVMIVIILCAKAGMYFMYKRSTPAAAEASDTKATQVIKQFMSDKDKNFTLMQKMLTETKGVVDQFRGQLIIEVGPSQAVDAC